MEKVDAKIKRLIDANFNRLREGLRVVEDIARFVLDNKRLTEEIKNMRSEVGNLQKEYDFLDFRDTPNDTGTTLSSDIEKKRENINEIISANLKRAEESERVLEEIFKLFDIKVSAKFKQLRYKTYTLERELLKSHE
ncbi:hypothetical protein [Hippea alviniae]|uniref:hypothetical protein n=1 Tax=Hippea alviniae TaxID=1279027 RepID=UPI0003B3991F|nr:hypothetical protein [Hippea alviniae]